MTLSSLRQADCAASAIRIVERYLEGHALFYGHGALGARDEAGWLVFAVCGLDHAAQETGLAFEPSSEQLGRIETIARQRVEARQPLAYLLGEAWFAGLKFAVNADVLIPRSPIAELIHEGFAPWLGSRRLGSALEIGTGSGCIAIALAHYWPTLNVVATDISPEALLLARQNAAAHGVSEQVEFVAADVFSGLDERRFDLIVSNPPYVCEETMAALPHEYRHEPRDALAGGTDGLSIVRRLLAGAADYLTEDGVLVVEVGESQQRFSACFSMLPVTWLEFSDGDSGVFVLTRTELALWQSGKGA